MVRLWRASIIGRSGAARCRVVRKGQDSERLRSRRCLLSLPSPAPCFFALAASFLVSILQRCRLRAPRRRSLDCGWSSIGRVNGAKVVVENSRVACDDAGRRRDGAARVGDRIRESPGSERRYQRKARTHSVAERDSDSSRQRWLPGLRMLLRPFFSLPCVPRLGLPSRRLNS